MKLLFRIWELIRRENNADTSAAITCAIHHLVLRFHSYYLPLCQSYLCNRGNSAHFYSELFSIKNYIIDVISHGYFTTINSTRDGNLNRPLRTVYLIDRPPMDRFERRTMISYDRWTEVYGPYSMAERMDRISHGRKQTTDHDYFP